MHSWGKAKLCPRLTPADVEADGLRLKTYVNFREAD